MNNETICTKFGNATKDGNGYYRISSVKEGNFSKLFHRLVFEDFYKISLEEEFPNGIHIHHIDKDITNNEIWNLEPITPSDHQNIHHKGISLSLKSKENMCKGHNNSTGFFRVGKTKTNSCNQGFTWVYRYYEGKHRKSLGSTDIKKLKEKVLAKGLEWFVIDEKKAKKTWSN